MKTTAVSKRRPTLTAVTLWLILALMALFLIFSRIASEAVLNALTLCYRTLVPALFPFLVLTGLLTKGGFAAQLGRKLGGPIGTLFGINGIGAVPMLIGMLCGFPTGASAVAELHKEGHLTAEDAERGLLLSSSASPGFLIAGIGAGMLASPERGLYLYLLQLTAIFVVTLLFALIFGKTASVPYSPVATVRRPFSSYFSEALRDAVDHILSICGSVIFFSVLAGFFLTLKELPNPLLCLLVGSLELTACSSLTAALLPADLAFIVIAAACGWSGLSVHTQIAAVTGGKLPLRRYLAGKLLVSLLTALLAALLVYTGIV